MVTGGSAFSGDGDYSLTRTLTAKRVGACPPAAARRQGLTFPLKGFSTMTKPSTIFPRIMAWRLACSCSRPSPALADAGGQGGGQGRLRQHLGALFAHFHRNPELSFKETATAKRMAAELRKAGAEVTNGVGGTGVVGVMRNGAGPTVLVRADMDGLPVEEKSGLPYASKVRQMGHRRVESIR